VLPYLFARRYLFAKKSTNAINVISAISVLGMTLGSAALIIVLSVFNGFEDLITSLYNSFNADLKIAPQMGKTFVPDSVQVAALRQIKGVKAVSQTLEEVAFFEYDKHQDFGIIKGVDTAFAQCNGIKAAIKRGKYALMSSDRTVPQAVVGLGMEYKLGIDVENPVAALKIYMPTRGQNQGLMAAPFRVQSVQPIGTFAIQADFDGQYVLADLDYIRQLTANEGGEVSFLEIGIGDKPQLSRIQAEAKRIMGNDFVIKNRYEQDEAFYKIMNMERWVGFAIATLTLLLVAFNMVGSLWMLVIDKQKDIGILRAMGATPTLIRNIFLMEGILLSALGMTIGFVLSISFILAQQHFGIIPLEGNMVVASYPISMRVSDFVLVGITVGIIGLLAAYLPARKAAALAVLDL
jgi:lipoprotein-releasing system permease protein